MAEGGSRNIGKVLHKKVTRTKEKVLQNLGKADKTKDDQFEQHEANFSEQVATAFKLQKALKAYSERLKEMSQTSTSLYRTMKEVYGADWVGYTDFCAAHEEVMGIWDNYSLNIDEQVVAPLNNYIALFPKYKEKIAKRKRKMTDFDSARHSHDSVVNAKKMDDNKITKAQEDLNEAKHIYESINSSITDELSSFHKSRVHTLSTAFHNLINTEINFHKNSIKMKKAMDFAIEKLKEDAEKFVTSGSHDHHDDDGSSETMQRSHSTEDDQRYVDLDFKVAHQMLVPPQKSKISIKNQSSNNDENSTPPHISSSQLEGKAEDEPTTPTNDSSRHTMPRVKVTSPAVPAPTYQSVIAERNLRNSTTTKQSEEYTYSTVTPKIPESPINASPINASPTIATPTIASPTIATPTIASPIIASPIIASPTIASPITTNSITKNNDNNKTEDNNKIDDDSKTDDDDDDNVKKQEDEISDKSNPTPPVTLNSSDVTKVDLNVVEKEMKEPNDVETVPNSEGPIANGETKESPAVESSEKKDGELYDIPVPKHQGVVPVNRVLFRVKATHTYVGEDMDELTFEAGEVITVVPFDNPEDKDDGWLMGVKETSRERGVFPENFTTRLE